MSSVLVVVIVGVIIAVIAWATLSDGSKPPTRRPRPPREAPPTAAPWAPPPLTAPEPATDVDERGVLRQLRSAGLLCLTVVVLGSVAAGLIGAVVLVGAHFLDSALG